MKRFLVFSYDDYYPYGGMNDFKGDFDTLIEAYQAGTTRHDNLQIYDSVKMERLDIDKIITEALNKYE